MKEENSQSALDRICRVLVHLGGASVLVFLCAPILIVVLMSFSDKSALQFPPTGFSLRWYQSFASNPVWIEAFWTSFKLAIVSSGIAVMLGTLAAYGMARSKGRWVGAMESNFMAPMIIPHIITALALYFMFATLGVLGTFTGLVIGHSVVAMPFVVSVIGVAVKAVDQRIEDSARTLGANRFRVFWSITLPNILPSIAVAWIFAFIISFDEVVVTYFLAGNHVTIPKKMFNDLGQHLDPTITAVASLLITLSVLLLMIVAKLHGARGVKLNVQ
ncbi:ABC transporter permease [Ramlibacter sp. 2FC]|uniref:ABC transporter permease n=1 Tax=Ramlibacter sp. 2FC TaxID=2502188 RepID=UPI0010F43FA8|nr:ABC transporter permease [Ramlibacter sp. 2FC]